MRSEGRVSTIRDDDALADRCERNVLARAWQNVVIHRAAAWDVGGGSSPSLPRIPGAFPVRCHLFPGRSRPHTHSNEIALGRPLSAIKVDVQGADLRALMRARAGSLRHKPAK